MGATSYKVTVWSLQTRYKTGAAGKRVPARYVVRWKVEDERFDQTFKLYAQADSFRSDLKSAAKRGEAFDVETGLPESKMPPPEKPADVPWVRFACQYADMKWDDISPKHRASIADSLVAITLHAAPNTPGRPETSVASRALRWAFNKGHRHMEPPERFAGALLWFEGNCWTVAEFAAPERFRAVYSALARKRDGERAARSTVKLRRAAHREAFDYAIECKLLDANPYSELTLKKVKTVVRQVDKRSVVNPIQFRTILNEVRRIAPRLVLFFALLFFAGMRPEEATAVRRSDFELPPRVFDETTGEWQYADGEIHLSDARPDIAGEWTDSGERSEAREQLKHREKDDGRTVPCPAELTRLVYEHIDAYGVAADGRLVRGQRDDRPLSSSVYLRVWGKARAVAFVPEVAASPLGKRPYDLRHAAVSVWLSVTGDPVRVAAWAGHTVAVLLRVYAKVIDGGEQQARARLAAWLKGAA